MRVLALVNVAIVLMACGPATNTAPQPATQTVACAAAARAVRDAVGRLREELNKLDLELRNIGTTCSSLPADKAAAAELIFAAAKLPRVSNGLAESSIASKDLQSQYPGEWTKAKSNLGTNQLKSAELSLTAIWCIRRTQECFDTQAAVDKLGQVQFEPVLSWGAWQVRVEVQPREVTRHVKFLNGLGLVIAEYTVRLTYQADDCAITKGTEALDIAVNSFDNGLFQEARQTDGPVIYKGTDNCTIGAAKRDWIRARATMEVRTSTNPAIPFTAISTIGVTKSMTIRFEVSSAGEDRTQVDK